MMSSLLLCHIYIVIVKGEADLMDMIKFPCNDFIALFSPQECNKCHAKCLSISFLLHVYVSVIFKRIIHQWFIISISNIICMSCGRWVSLKEALNSNLGQQEKVIMGNIKKYSG